MKKSIRFIFFPATALLLLSMLTAGAALGESCRVENKQGTEVWLRVYQEDEHGQKGRLIEEFRLGRDEIRQVHSDTRRIRVDYKNDPREQDYHGDVGAWCQRDEIVRVP